MEKPLSVVRLAFGGLKSNVNPHRIGGNGMAAQDNIGQEMPGQLSCRKGMRPTSFTNGATTATTADIRGVFCFQTPLNQQVLAYYSNGTVRMGKSPS